MTAQDSKIRSRWWYLLPSFLGVIGGIISWVALKSFDRNLAKNCIVLGVILSVSEVALSLVLFIYSDNLNLITQFDSISETGDFGIKFKIDTP
ncbi:MAG: hypothetical protein OEQ12_05225 [Nitrosopumilus sp.]|nr:hypothetical protein [Nitrosopumilus sp.]